MNKTKTLFLSLFFLILSPFVMGQTILKMTTLASAVTTSSTTQIPLTSATGVTATSTVLFVADGAGEAMFVNSVPTNGTTVGVTRGYQSLGKARPHASGALVFIVPLSNGVVPINTVQPTGSCTRSNITYLPVISVGLAGTAAVISDCVGGVWVNGNIAPQGNTPYNLLFPNSGGTAYTSLNTSGTTLSATTMYCTEIDMPFSKLVTGIGILNGTTATTNNHLVALYDATGNLIANSATAGVLASGASTYQNIAFTAQYYLVGPAQYFGCMQTNGATATVRMIVSGTQDTYLTKGVTSQTFGTIPSTITVPTTFTTVVGPYELIY